MSGVVTGFQRPYTFKANATYTTVGTDQAVVYVAGTTRTVEVPTSDNQVPVGIVTYQYGDRDGQTVAVQLNNLADLVAAEAISAGDDVIVGAGGKAKKASGLSAGTKANVLGEAQNNAAIGEKVQVLIQKKKYEV